MFLASARSERSSVRWGLNARRLFGASAGVLPRHEGFTTDLPFLMGPSRNAPGLRCRNACRASLCCIAKARNHFSTVTGLSLDSAGHKANYFYPTIMQPPSWVRT